VRFLPLLAGTVLAPLPATRRGYGIVLNASPKADKIIYTNGRVVVVRSLAVSVFTCQRLNEPACCAAQPEDGLSTVGFFSLASFVCNAPLLTYHICCVTVCGLFV